MNSRERNWMHQRALDAPAGAGCTSGRERNWMHRRAGRTCRLRTDGLRDRWIERPSLSAFLALSIWAGRPARAFGPAQVFRGGEQVRPPPTALVRAVGPLCCTAATRPQHGPAGIADNGPAGAMTAPSRDRCSVIGPGPGSATPHLPGPQTDIIQSSLINFSICCLHPSAGSTCGDGCGSRCSRPRPRY